MPKRTRTGVVASGTVKIRVYHSILRYSVGEDLEQPLHFERLARGPTTQRLRTASPLSSPRASRTFDARGTDCRTGPDHSEENVPMSERLPVRADAGGLAELLLPHLDSAYNLAR